MCDYKNFFKNHADLAVLQSQCVYTSPPVVWKGAAEVQLQAGSCYWGLQRRFEPQTNVLAAQSHPERGEASLQQPPDTQPTHIVLEKSSCYVKLMSFSLLTRWV